MGAERAASPGGVAEYAGKYLDSWPGLKSPQGYTPGPYADEKPLFKITAANSEQYKDKLTAGQKALLKAYPDYSIAVYPSHRDFRTPDWVCDVNKKNAANAEIAAEGLAVNATSGSIPFPFPHDGLEAVWNVSHTYRVWTEACIQDVADVYANGTVAWSKQKFVNLNVFGDPKNRTSTLDGANAHIFQEYYSPPREKGFISVVYAPNSFAKSGTVSWQYIPGTRRVRQSPEVGYDYPVPPASARTVDDDYGFNGSPDRYDWKIVGKKEIYVPYNNFKINDPSLKYSDILRKGTINSDYVRYELHRVWVLEGSLKQGVRHIYKKRELYVDEDTWLTAWADNYDGRGNLWRVTYVTSHYAPAAQAYHRGVTVYHDLQARSYQSGYMVNEAGDNWWKFNDPSLRPDQFTSAAAATAGR